MTQLDDGLRVRVLTERITTRATTTEIAAKLSTSQRPVTKNAVCGIVFRARKSGELAALAKRLREAPKAAPVVAAAKGTENAPFNKPPVPPAVIAHPKPPSPPPPPPPPVEPTHSPPPAVVKPAPAAPVRSNDYETMRAKVIEMHRATGAGPGDVAGRLGIKRSVARGIIRRFKETEARPRPQPAPVSLPVPPPVLVPEGDGREALRAKVFNAHLSGSTYAEIAAQFGLSRDVARGIVRRVKEKGVQPSPKPEPEPQPLSFASRAEEDKAALRLRGEGLSLAAVAKRIGITPKAAEKRLARLTAQGITTPEQYERADARGDIRRTSGPDGNKEQNDTVLGAWAAGKSEAQISAQLGISEDTVSGVLYRARKKGDDRAIRRCPERKAAPRKEAAAAVQEPKEPPRKLVMVMVSPWQADAAQKKAEAQRAQAHADRMAKAKPMSQAEEQRAIERHMREKGVTHCPTMGIRSFQSEYGAPTSAPRWRSSDV